MTKRKNGEQLELKPTEQLKCLLLHADAVVHLFEAGPPKGLKPHQRNRLAEAARAAAQVWTCMAQSMEEKS